jgi:glycosyltransferase involved in cell wall biosynthesis
MKPRVLLSAYQCGPGMGSVSQIGWEWYSRLRARAAVTLVTHVRNREALVNAGAPLAGSDVHYIDTEWCAGPLYRTASRIFPKSQHSAFLVSSLDYFPYDHGVIQLLRGMAPAQRWDVVHAVTPVSPSGATRLHTLGLPVVLGPWNGGLPPQTAFPEIMREDAGWLYKIREIGRLLDRAFGTTACAALILSANRTTDLSIVPKHRARCFRMIENGVNLNLFRSSSRPPAPSALEPLRVVFTGRLVPFKGIGMLIEAVRRARAEFPVALTVVGDGPMRKELIDLACSAGLEDVVQFPGNLPLSGVAAEMARAHVFCLASVRESGGAVVLEAMACALPVMAVNYGGPAEIVDDQIGRLLSAEGPAALISDMVRTFRDIVADPDLWRRKGLAGRERAERLYSWDAKIESAIGLYEKLIGEKAIRKEQMHASFQSA